MKNMTVTGTVGLDMHGFYIIVPEADQQRLQNKQARIRLEKAIIEHRAPRSRDILNVELMSGIKDGHPYYYAKHIIEKGVVVTNRHGNPLVKFEKPFPDGIRESEFAPAILENLQSHDITLTAGDAIEVTLQSRIPYNIVSVITHKGIPLPIAEVEAQPSAPEQRFGS